MFWRRRAQKRWTLPTGASVQGTLRGSGVLEINGVVNGEIHHDGLLLVGPAGVCGPVVTATSIRLAGELSGTVRVAEKLEILPEGRASGDITFGSLTVHPGGLLIPHFEAKELKSTEEQSMTAHEAKVPAPTPEPTPEPASEEPLMQPRRQNSPANNEGRLVFKGFQH